MLRKEVRMPWSRVSLEGGIMGRRGEVDFVATKFRMSSMLVAV